jgi:hypothetical protein
LGNQVDIGATEAHVMLHGTTLDIYGTELDDTISVAPGNVSIDRIGTTNVDVNAYNTVRVYALDGNDHVSTDDRISKSISIYGGSGNDTIHGGAGMARRKKSVTLVWTEILECRITRSHERGRILDF